MLIIRFWIKSKYSALASKLSALLHRLMLRTDKPFIGDDLTLYFFRIGYNRLNAKDHLNFEALKSQRKYSHTVYPIGRGLLSFTNCLFLSQ